MKTILFFIFSFPAMAQIKVGALTLPDSIAKAYFLDCYKHPDTMSMRTTEDFGCCTNCTISTDLFRNCHQLALEFNKKLAENSLSGEIIKTTYYKAYYDTIYDHNDVLFSATGMNQKDIDNYNKKHRGKVRSVKLCPAGSYRVKTGKFLIPRKPTEIDFIKWIHKAQKAFD